MSASPNPSGMSPGRRTLIRVIIAVIACIALLIPLVGGVSNFSQRVNTKESTETSALPETMSRLEVDADKARVQISTTPSSTGQATLEFRGTSRDVPKISLDSSGGITRVSITGMDSSDFLDRDEVRLTIEVPEDQARQLDLASTSTFAHTLISGAFRNVAATTTTGMIEADVTTENLQLRAKSGAVDVSGRVASADLDTNFGAISAAELNVSERLVATSQTGAVEILLGSETLPKQGIDIDVSSGAVDLRVPRIPDVEDTEATGYQVDAQTDSGGTDVTIDEVDRETEEPFVPISVNSKSGFVDIAYL